ncbi:helicase associated domain-containing protein [Pontibacter ummariensis]|uniref:helicase associated domain-containing protein n=1 Tax=Pontibacter ummariensis TaxID=1610492 RepID=UPI0015C638EE|nr:helicase associated domain-containing protein [Pontibacter ummariensis]
MSKDKTYSPCSLDNELAQWAGIQKRIKHMLPEGLQDQLTTLSTYFREEVSPWETMYSRLANYSQDKGHICLPQDEKYEDLQDWLIRQVIGKRLLTEDQFQRLDLLGVDWNLPVSREHRWEQMYTRLKDFYRTFGHCKVPQRWVKDKQLANWVTVQRNRHAKQMLREDRFRMLNDLGFIWTVKEVYKSQWESFFLKLKKFYLTNGHCKVPCKHQKLVSWMERQRLAKKNNSLSPSRERRLNELNFTWSHEGIKKKLWDKKYEQLSEYRKVHGHCLVPLNYKEDKSLGIWVSTQRRLDVLGRLESAKKKRLNHLNFVWSGETKQQIRSIYDSRWDANFEKLRSYKQRYSSCQVSTKIDSALQRWTSLQRQLFYQDRLSSERVDKLNRINFPWSVHEGYWMKMYETLTNYKVQFGHTQVPYNWKPNPQLAAWVYRIKANKQDLSPSKIDLLNKIDFDWTLRRKTIIPWKDMYKRLEAFKQEHGHTRVKTGWSSDPKLAKWVSRMRFEKEALPPERLSLLDKIGFDWGIKAHQRNQVG